MQKVQVLYVDDEIDLLEIGRIYLEMSGEFQVDTAERGRPALEILKQKSYDAIISDYQMPEMDGIALLKEVRAGFGKIPFILFTGRGREEVVVEALNNGADFYLQKGGDPTAQFTELAHKIRLAVAQRRALQALSESESRFRDLTENSLDTIMLFDRSLRHLYVNPNVETQTGIPPERFIGKTHAEMGFPEDLVELWDRALTGVFESGKKDRIEFKIPSGVWIDWLLVPIHAPDGNVVQVITSARDITDRKRAEEQIRLAEFSLEHSGITTFWLDEEARVLRANQAACDALGYTREEFTHLRVFDIDPLYQQEAWTQIWSRIAREKYVVIESIHRRKDGSSFPVEIASTYFEYEGKKIIHSFARDISERKHAEAAIRESEAKYRTLFEQSKEPMLIVDNGHFIDCNNATLALLGLRTKEEFLKLTPARISPPVQPDGRNSAEKAGEMIETALREGSHQFEWLHCRTNGELFWAEVSLTVIPLGDRRIIHTIWRDITKRKNAEEELKAAYEQITASEEELRENYDELSLSEQRSRESEKRLKDIINFSPDATFAIDTSGKVIAWNRAIEEITGVPASEMLGKDNYEYALPFYGHRRPLLINLIEGDDEFLNRNYTGIRREANTITAETSLVRLRGENRTISIKATRFYNDHGEITGAIESMRDITPLRNAEIALKEREAFFKALFDQASQLAGVLDVEGNLIRVNNTALSLIGEDPSAVLNRPFWETPWWSHDPAQQKQVRDAVARARNGETVRFEATHYDSGRNLHHLDFSLKPIVGENNRVLALLPEGRDITERKRSDALIREAYDRIAKSEEELRKNYDELATSEQKIRESERALSTLMENLPGMAYRCRNDREWTMEFISEGCLDLTGYPPSDLVGSRIISYAECIHPEDRQRVWDEVQRAVEEHRTFNILYRILTKDGMQKWVWEKGAGVFAQDGRLVSIEGFINDITEKENTLDALRLAEFSIEHTGVATFWFDRSSQIVRVNEASCLALGYTREELLGMKVRDIDPDFPSESEWERSWNQAKELGEYKISESRHRRKDGTIFPVEIVSSYFMYGSHEYLFSFVRDITERIQADEMLRESEERYRSVVNDQTDMIARFTPDGVITFVNEAYRSYYAFHLALTEVPGKTIREIMQVQNYDQVQQFLDSLVPGSPVREMEREFTGADGRQYWQSWTVRAIFSADGSVTEFQVVGRDITDKKYTQIALKTSEEQYRSLVETTGTGYVILDRTGRVVTANSEYLRLTGRSSLDEILGRQVVEWTAPHDLERNAREVEVCLRNGQVRNLEIDYLKPDGSLQPVEINASVVGSGPEQNILTLCRDISGRRAAETALREEQQFTRLLLDTSPAFFVAIGADGKTIAMNRALIDALEYTQEEIRGADYLTTFVPEEDRPALADIFRQIVQEDRETVNQNRILAKSGRALLVEWHGRPVKQKGHDREFFVGVGIDISKRIDAEKALQQANNKLNLLNTITRHDMLNQLVALKGFLELMRAKAGDLPFVTYFDRCSRITENLERQINFTRDYQDMGVKAPVWQDVRELVLKNAAALPLGDVRVMAECSGIEVYADPLFEKVFYNLIDNALRYAGSGLTRIRFSCTETDQGLRIRCEDDGAGIAPEDKKSLFVRGFGKNTGLGLFLTREILGLTGITIAESGEPGTGARFDMLVPAGAFRSRHRS